MAEDFQAFTTSAPGLSNVLVTEVGVGVAKSIRKARNIPFAPKRGVAIWDTGATNSVISEKCAKTLSLIPFDMASVHGVHGEELCKVYKVDIFLPNSILVSDVRVTEAKNILNADMLIGMDIIVLGDLSICNSDMITSFSFRIPPDDRRIDYVKRWKVMKHKQSAKSNRLTVEAARRRAKKKRKK